MVAPQAPLSVEFSKQEYWSGLPFSSPGDFSDPGIELRSLALQADSLPPEPPGKPHFKCIKMCKYLLLRTFYRTLDFSIQLNI